MRKPSELRKPSEPRGESVLRDDCDDCLRTDENRLHDESRLHDQDFVCCDMRADTTRAINGATPRRTEDCAEIESGH